ncbi:MAG: GGDEF domain-containing protein, partial [Armatimonadota bacterium]
MTQKEALLAQQQNEELQALNRRLVATLAEKDALHAELSRNAVTDELTGVSNRRQVMEFGRREFERHRRLEAPLTVIMLDVDQFKGINDRFGHAAGDEVLRLVARTCAEGVRSIDAFGRWGGEEFCIILPGARLD